MAAITETETETAPAVLVEAVSPRAAAARRSKLASRSSSSIGATGGGAAGSIEYTSLRDVLVDGGGGGGDRTGGSWREYSGHDIHGFDAANIGIRNHLVKHAASKYLQSAVLVAPRNQTCCLGRLWRQVQICCCGDDGDLGGGGSGVRRRGGRGRVLRRACSWPGCPGDPVGICSAFIGRAARRVAAFFVGCVAGVWAQ